MKSTLAKPKTTKSKPKATAGNSLPTQYKGWDIIDEMPDGWSIDRTIGSPLTYTVFVSNGKSVFTGKKLALLKVIRKPEDETNFQRILMEHVRKGKHIWHSKLENQTASQPGKAKKKPGSIAPNLFDAPEKAKKKPSCKSAKPEKVYTYSEEIKLIRKFLALDGKAITQRRAELLHQEISQAIAEKRVRKTGKYAALVKLVAEKVATLYQRMVSENIKRLDNLTIKDRAAIAKMCEASGSIEKRYAVQMINRYAKLQGKNPKTAQVELLLNLIKAGRKAGKLPKSDKDTAQVNRIEAILLVWKKSKGILPVSSGKLSGLGCPGEDCGCKKKALTQTV